MKLHVKRYNTVHSCNFQIFSIMQFHAAKRSSSVQICPKNSFAQARARTRARGFPWLFCPTRGRKLELLGFDQARNSDSDRSSAFKTFRTYETKPELISSFDCLFIHGGARNVRSHAGSCCLFASSGIHPAAHKFTAAGLHANQRSGSGFSGRGSKGFGLSCSPWFTDEAFNVFEPAGERLATRPQKLSRLTLRRASW